MSLTPEAINRIAELSANAAIPVTDLTNGQAIALPGAMGIHDLEKFMLTRRRFRGEMNTEQVAAFCEYIQHQGAAEVFINTDDMQAAAFFDMGSREEPGHCEHRAALSLNRTAAYTALLKINGQANSQRELAEWLEDWGRFVECFDDEDKPLHISKALASVRKMTVETARKLESEDHNMGHKLSAMEQIDVRSAGQQLGGILFTCAPYHGFEERQFTLPLSALTGGDSIRLKLRVQELEAIMEEIADEFRSKIEDALTGDSFNVWMGTFKA